MSKKVAIMQPYFLPYMGYFHLLNSVDEFVIYDNIQYTKKGWINRNRILVNGKDKLISLPLKKGSDYLNVIDRKLSDNWDGERSKLLNLIKSSYKRSPQYSIVFPIIEKCIQFPDNNLFNFILNSLTQLNLFLEIDTKVTISSAINIDHTLKSKDKVIAICKNLDATTYINAIGGQELYNVEDFKNHKLDLKFIKSSLLNYKQYKNEFIPWLSILDILFFNEKQDIIKHLNEYTLI